MEMCVGFYVFVRIYVLGLLTVASFWAAKGSPDGGQFVSNFLFFVCATAILPTTNFLIVIYDMIKFI